MAKKKKTPVRTVTLKIPGELYDRINTLIEGTGFRSPTEFAIHVLRDVVAGGRLEQGATPVGERELETVRERLRALGYIE